MFVTSHSFNSHRIVCLCVSLRIFCCCHIFNELFVDLISVGECFSRFAGPISQYVCGFCCCCCWTLFLSLVNDCTLRGWFGLVDACLCFHLSFVSYICVYYIGYWVLDILAVDIQYVCFWALYFSLLFFVLRCIFILSILMLHSLLARINKFKI